MLRKEAINKEIKDAPIINLFKQKGNPEVCENYRHIFLLSTDGKILERVSLWMNTLNSQGFYQKANVDSGR